MPDLESATERLAAWRCPAPPGSEPGEVAGKTTPYCVPCGYNLTGLTSARCPECGWIIDWRLARLDEERGRTGTPAYVAKGWQRLWAPWLTVWWMLFRPVAFARRLRQDEPWLPALSVALSAALLGGAMWWLGHGFHKEDPRWVGIYASSILACILVNTVGFLLANGGHPGSQRTSHRLKLFVLFSLYSTGFIAAWGLTAPPRLEGLDQASFLWPLHNPLDHADRLVSDGAFLGRTIIFYWWAAILWVFAFTRTRPRWAAVFFIPVPPAAAFAGCQVGAAILL